MRHENQCSPIGQIIARAALSAGSPSRRKLRLPGAVTRLRTFLVVPDLTKEPKKGRRAPRGVFSHATIIVAAAGNESHRELQPDFEVAVSPPAIADGIVSVAALGQGPAGLTTAPFSNTGANVSAPGVGIISAAPGGGLQSMSGTSMATPHVAGVVALWAQELAQRGMLNAFDLIGKLAGSATGNGLKEGFDPVDVGAGLVQCPQAQ